MERSTGVDVAPRPSTIRDANIIYVFDGGEIKELGTHDELVCRGSWYYNLVKCQLTKGDEAQHDDAAVNQQRSSSRDGHD